MTPLDAKTARDDIEPAFKLAYSYRNSDAAQAIIAYLSARIAYYQAALIDASENVQALQHKAKVVRDLRDALTANEGAPRTIV